MKLPTIPRDKILHFAAGAAVSLLVCLFASAWFGVVASLVAGGAKEWHDRKHGGTADFLDAVATVLGGFVVATVFGMF